MGTRANIKVIDTRCEDVLWFYKHEDGDPNSMLPLLKKFMLKIVNGKLRDNVCQAAGWLVLFGRNEMLASIRRLRKKGFDVSGSEWKIGYIQPTTDQHSDIEFLYTLDLNNKTISVCKLENGYVRSMIFDGSKTRLVKSIKK